MNDKAFSLIEVMVAVTMIGMTAAGTLGILGYHRSSLARVEARFQICNEAMTLSREVLFQLKDAEETFPMLEKDEKYRDFDGMERDLKWRARLERHSIPGVLPFFKILFSVSRGTEKIDIVRYLPGWEQQEDPQEEEKLKEDK